jgi:hypothetical protein
MKNDLLFSGCFNYFILHVPSKENRKTMIAIVIQSEEGKERRRKKNNNRK